MTHLDGLRSAKSFHDIASLLGFKPRALAYIIYKIPVDQRYESFDIPKKRGGYRKISAPNSKLKLVQQRLANILQNCVEELNKSKRINDHISHGFKRKRSILTNAKKHRNRRYVFNIDLNDFFGSINFGRVRGFFIKDTNFKLEPNIATILAQICCHDHSLPQGAPTSPVISNLIGHILDIHLVKLASTNGCSYTRYADDITFSTNKRNFPENIAKQENINIHDWAPGHDLDQLIKISGFTVNPTKTRMQYCDSRQEVTGLIVNKKINVRSDYRHTVRAMVHHLFTHGFYYLPQNKPPKETEISEENKGTMDQLHGMLGFIDSVDLYNKKNASSAVVPRTEKQKLTSKESIYRRFLLFKLFYKAKAPVIICEGKTDNIYITHAIRSLAKNHPNLASINNDGSIQLKVRLFKYSETSTGRILGINGGTGELTKFIPLYHNETKKFKAPGCDQPIIIIVDNDSGSNGSGKTFSAVKAIKKDANPQHAPFTHITQNLYLIATPLSPDRSDSMIEDFFTPETLSIEIGGKTFNRGNGINLNKEYGKNIFAQHVVKTMADSIDFRGFNPILSTIETVITTHAKTITSESEET